MLSARCFHARDNRAERTFHAGEFGSYDFQCVVHGRQLAMHKIAHARHENPFAQNLKFVFCHANHGCARDYGEKGP